MVFAACSGWVCDLLLFSFADWYDRFSVWGSWIWCGLDISGFLCAVGSFAFGVVCDCVWVTVLVFGDW